MSDHPNIQPTGTTGGRLMAARSYRVLVSEQRTLALVDAQPINYLSPPQPEAEARALATLLAGATLAGDGPWRQPIAGGQRTIQLKATES